MVEEVAAGVVEEVAGVVEVMGEGGRFSSSSLPRPPSRRSTSPGSDSRAVDCLCLKLVTTRLSLCESEPRTSGVDGRRRYSGI